MRLRNLACLFVLSVLFFTFTKTIYSQDQFEGKVTINVYDEGKAHTMDYFVKGSKILFDAKEEGRAGRVVMDPSAGQFMIIMPEEKMYMVMQMPDIKTKSETSEKADETNFSRTGETKEILGHTAEKWIYKDGNDQGEAWMTKEIGAFKLLDNPM